MTIEGRGDSAHEPERDTRGRFRRGSSGNPTGRPPKRPKGPWTLQKAFAEVLDEEVPVREGGVTGTLVLRDVIIKKMVRALANAKPRETMQILRWMQSFGGFEPAPIEEEPIYTEEDRRLLEIISKEYVSCVCDTCGGSSLGLAEKPEANWEGFD